jgi:hypothetical protein
LYSYAIRLPSGDQAGTAKQWLPLVNRLTGVGGTVSV